MKTVRRETQFYPKSKPNNNRVNPAPRITQIAFGLNRTKMKIDTSIIIIPTHV